MIKIIKNNLCSFDIAEKIRIENMIVFDNVTVTLYLVNKVLVLQVFLDK
jgi:hypothetical protein